MNKFKIGDIVTIHDYDVIWEIVDEQPSCYGHKCLFSKDSGYLDTAIYHNMPKNWAAKNLIKVNKLLLKFLEINIYA